MSKKKDKQKIRTAKRREFSKPSNDTNRGYRAAGSQNRKKTMSIKDRRGNR